jgi:hypothetical protein
MTAPLYPFLPSNIGEIFLGNFDEESCYLFYDCGAPIGWKIHRVWKDGIVIRQSVGLGLKTIRSRFIEWGITWKQGKIYMQAADVAEKYLLLL